MAARATSRRRRTLILAAALSAVALPGCFTGERPTLASGPLTSGDPAVDEVLIRLDTAPRSTFTGTYEAAAREADLLTPATVSQEGTERRSVTIGDVRFLYDGSSMATCDLADETCSDAIESDWVSDTELTPDFYATGAAARLRADAEARTGQTVAAVEDIAGYPATCVTVPLANDESSTYCALDSGALARIDASDLRVDLSAWSGSVDESAFSRPD
jgi:hypothetical protein